MNLKPLHDRVLVERVNSEDKTKGGIIIPDTAQEKPMEGKVLAVGGGARNENGQIVTLDVKKGDRILFGKWSGTEVKIDGKELLIMILLFSLDPIFAVGVVTNLRVPSKPFLKHF